MSTLKKRPIELVLWSNVREENDYPKDDDNDGYEFGIDFIDENDEFEPMDAQWFREESKMWKFINGNELKVLKKS